MLTSPKCKRPAAYGAAHRVAAFTAHCAQDSVRGREERPVFRGQMCTCAWACMHEDAGVASARTSGHVCAVCLLTVHTPALRAYTCVHASMWVCACVACVCGVCMCVHFVCACISMREHVWPFRDVLLKPRVSVWISLRAEPKARPVCVWLFGNVGLRARLPFSGL